jgi:hypothetical protein
MMNRRPVNGCSTRAQFVVLGLVFFAPGFVLKASDEDAKAIADEDDVKEVDADVLLRNVTQP